MSATNEIVSFVQCGNEHGVEIDRPDAVVGLLQTDVLIDERVREVEQFGAEPKGAGRRDLLHEEVQRVKGDSKSAYIASASTFTKTLRDGLLEEMDATFPGYGLAQHKGYPTAEHVEQIRRHGATPHHRRSFQPVREALGLAPRQQNLFSI